MLQGVQAELPFEFNAKSISKSKRLSKEKLRAASKVLALIKKCNKLLISVYDSDTVNKKDQWRGNPAREHFNTVKEIHQLAKSLGVVNNRFLADADGFSIGQHAEVYSEKGNYNRVIAGNWCEIFNYDKHCRTPVTVIKEAATQTLKGLIP